jgi:hypothetical protein
MQRGKNKAQQERYANLRPEQRRSRVWGDLAAWAGEKPVFWFARSLDVVDQALPSGADYRSIAEVDAPVMLGPGGGGGAGMPGLPGRGGMAGGGRGLPGAGGPGRGFMPQGGAGPMGGPGFTGGPGMPGSGRGGMGAESPARLRIVRIELPKS